MSAQRDARDDATRATTAQDIEGVQGGEERAADAQSQEVVHVVGRGQTLSGISQMHLGSSRHWEAIYRANRGVIGRNPNGLRIGMKLTIPNLGGAPKAPTTASGETSEIVHRVQRGENLSDVSEAHYGTSNRWHVIYNANREAIGRNPDRLRVGMRLVIPPREQAEVEPPKAVVVEEDAPPKAVVVEEGEGGSGAVGLEESGTTEHTVKAGESLVTIARRYYKSSVDWRGLFEANRGVIGHDPDMLAPGMVLTIPEPDKLPTGKGTGAVTTPSMPHISRSDQRYQRDFKRGWGAYQRIHGDQETASAVADASSKTGVAHKDLSVMAAMESSGNKDASRGSYRGLMQMGRGATADAGMDWGEVSTDVGANAEAGAKYWQVNERQLERAGYESNVLHQYLAHQQGFTGFRRMMEAIAKNPNAPATSNQLNNMEVGVVRDLRRRNGAVTQKDFYDYWMKRIQAHEDAYDAFQKALAGEGDTSNVPVPERKPAPPGGDKETSPEPDKGEAPEEALPSGNVSTNFTWQEFACKDGTAVPQDLRPNVIALAAELEKLREALGGRAISINSGYRTPSYNQRVGGASKSQHVQAKAADIRVSGLSARQVRKTLRRLISEGKMRNGGVGAYATFTHYDIGPARSWSG